MTGEIPAAVELYPKLGLLDLSRNMFFGAIPEGLVNSIQIRYLFLNDNILSGEIPQALARCTDLDTTATFASSLGISSFTTGDD